MFYVSYDTFPEYAATVRKLFAEELVNFENKSSFYREKFELIKSQMDYHWRDQFRLDPFYGTGEITDNLLFNTVIPDRESILSRNADLTFDHMIDALDRLRANPPSIKLRGLIDERPDYDQIHEMFQSYKPNERNAAQGFPRATGPATMRHG